MNREQKRAKEKQLRNKKSIFKRRKALFDILGAFKDKRLNIGDKVKLKKDAIKGKGNQKYVKWCNEHMDDVFTLKLPDKYSYDSRIWTFEELEEVEWTFGELVLEKVDE